MPIKVAIIGANFGANVHARAFQKDKRVRLVAISARDLDKVSLKAKELNIPFVYTDWRLMLKEQKPDAIAVAVPPSIQPAILSEAAKQGIAVFAEKPLAENLAKAKSSANFIQKKRLPCVINYEFTEIPEWVKAKELITQGRIGKIKKVTVVWRVQTFANKFKKISWKTQAGQGGGALSGFGCHTLHYLEWFLGKAVKISAKLSKAKDLPSNGDSLCVFSLLFQKNITTDAEINTHAAGCTQHEIRFFGEKGQIALINQDKDYVYGFRLFVSGQKDDKLSPVTLKKRFLGKMPDGRLEATASLVKKLLDWVESKKPARPDLNDALRVEYLLGRARASAAKKSAWMTV